GSVEVDRAEFLPCERFGPSATPAAGQEKDGRAAAAAAAPSLDTPQTFRSQHQLGSLLVHLAPEKEPPLLEKCSPGLHQFRLPSHLAEALRYPRVSGGLLLHEIPESPLSHGLPASHQLLAEQKEVVQREFL